MTTDKELTSDQEQMWQKLKNPIEYVVSISCVVSRSIIVKAKSEDHAEHKVFEMDGLYEGIDLDELVASDFCIDCIEKL